MSGLAIAAVIVAAYLTAGCRIAVARLPEAWAIARREWSLNESIRGSVHLQTACMILFWPCMLAFRALRARFDGVIGRGDPVALAKQVADRDRRIADLERELGIGR